MFIMHLSHSRNLRLAAGAFGSRFMTAKPASAQDWRATSAPSTNWTCVASSASGAELAASSSGAIYTSADSGATWTLTCAPSNSWSSIASSADGTTLVAVASDGAGPIYTSRNSGATWTPAHLPDRPPIGWTSVAASADGSRLVAVLNSRGIYTSQSIPTPVMNLTRSGGGALLSWTIPTLEFTLQQNSDLTTTNWMDVPTPPVLNLTKLQNQVIVSALRGNTFYRLKH